MWSLPLDTVESELGRLPRIAIETGTCLGNGTRALARRFERVITLELSAELHAQARQRLSGAEYAHVEFHHGDSAALLPEILGALEPDEPVFFFLDAHWSGDASVDWARAAWKGYGVDTAHRGSALAPPTGPEQCPLEDELLAITRHCLSEAHLLIDDLKNIPETGSGLRNHEFPGEDWTHLSRARLLGVVGPRLQNARELTDPRQWLLSLRSQERRCRPGRL